MLPPVSNSLLPAISLLLVFCLSWSGALVGEEDKEEEEEEDEEDKDEEAEDCLTS